LYGLLSSKAERIGCNVLADEAEQLKAGFWRLGGHTIEQRFVVQSSD